MKALRPRGTPIGSSTPWLILGLVWIGYGIGYLVWLAGRLAAVSTGRPWSTGPDYGPQFLGHLVRSQTQHLWPAVPGWLVATYTGVLLTVAGAGAAAGWRLLSRFRSRPADPLDSLATPADMESLTLPTIRRRAQQLRPSLNGVPADRIPADDAGVPLGRLQPRGPDLRGSWEDVAIALMAPRSGKTTALAIPTVLAAPGPALATSNKSDLWAATAALRTTDGRRVWVFDPQQIVFADRDWWWNPLDGITTVEEAERLAGHFVLTVDDPGRRDIWGPGATELLAALLLAAGISGGDLHHVYGWLTDDASQEPSDILADHPQFTAQANGLRGIQQTAWETKAGLYLTARTAARCLRNPQIMEWVTPPTDASPCFNPRQFVRSRDTIFLHSKDGGGSAGPLIAALTDRVIREATRRGESMGGRLDPPMPVVLDEAANICRIADLPNLYSHLGSRGVYPITILQSWAQGETVWGRSGMRALWGASTLKIASSGIDDPQLAEDLSRLIGNHDVDVASYSRGGRDPALSESVALRRQRILEPDKIRALRKGSAVLLATGCPAAMIDLKPWFTGPQADAISNAERAAKKTLVGRAALHERTDLR
ncbi:TraM recognition domain-containing protein [Polymorphospora sp. NPDC050346]|uniref:type IV secretory system conjugative DNA transfer family protein n=1 Tax=Polymorphospora sp. NPDC050346 TaxID=3155780 RepID=UPI0033D50219